MNTSLDYKDWNVLKRAEIIPLQVMELDAYQDDRIPEGEPEVCCSGCMYCLGLSWKDFL